MKKHLSEDQRCHIIADYLEGKRGKYFHDAYGINPHYARTLVTRSGFGKRGDKKPGPVKKIARRNRDWLIVTNTLPSGTRLQGIKRLPSAKEKREEILKEARCIFNRGKGNRPPSCRAVIDFIERHIA